MDKKEFEKALRQWGHALVYGFRREDWWRDGAERKAWHNVRKTISVQKQENIACA